MLLTINKTLDFHVLSKTQKYCTRIDQMPRKETK